jgi:hypothetical protein
MSEKHLERKEVLNLVYTRQADAMADAYARLKAEVERLTAEVSYDKRCELHTDKLAAEFTQAQVERLTKAGDAMAADLIGEFGSYNSVYDWRAAKDGKQP